MGAAGAQGPPVRNIRIQIPPTDLYTFPYSMSLGNLIKDKRIFFSDGHYFDQYLQPFLIDLFTFSFLFCFQLLTWTS